MSTAYLSVKSFFLILRRKHIGIAVEAQLKKYFVTDMRRQWWPWPLLYYHLYSCYNDM